MSGVINGMFTIKQSLIHNNFGILYAERLRVSPSQEAVLF